MKKTLLIFALLAMIGMVLSGCSTSTKPVNSNNSTVQDFGSFTTANEQPAFGDPTVAGQTNQETSYNDPSPVCHVVDSLEHVHALNTYYIRVLWGNLERDSNITAMTDWSGKMTVRNGAIRIVRTIAFDQGDSVVPWPHETFAVPNYVQWVSKTGPSFDGLGVRLFMMADSSNMDSALTFETVPITISFNRSQLKNLDTLIILGPGNAVSFHAVAWNPNPGLRGPVAGVWGRDENGKGIFYGTWMSRDGDEMGTLKGAWGTDSSGENIFVGKYIDNDGKFQGLLRGTWTRRGVGNNPAGHFEGVIYGPDTTDSTATRIKVFPVGVIRGQFKTGFKHHSGYFAGQWCVGDGCTKNPKME